jgi:hypothetical protein
VCDPKAIALAVVEKFRPFLAFLHVFVQLEKWKLEERVFLHQAGCPTSQPLVLESVLKATLMKNWYSC